MLLFSHLLHLNVLVDLY
jgi:hypothetical protein